MVAVSCCRRSSPAASAAPMVSLSKGGAKKTCAPAAIAIISADGDPPMTARQYSAGRVRGTDGAGPAPYSSTLAARPSNTASDVSCTRWPVPGYSPAWRAGGGLSRTARRSKRDAPPGDARDGASCDRVEAGAAPRVQREHERRVTQPQEEGRLGPCCAAV